jgi:hypothetical protein
MIESKNVNELFDTLARVLLRCFVLGYLLLLLWFGAYVVAGDAMIYGLAGKLFGLTPHEVDLIHYGGMVFVKCVVILFFLFPYLAIRLVLRKRT